MNNPGHERRALHLFCVWALVPWPYSQWLPLETIELFLCRYVFFFIPLLLKKNAFRYTDQPEGGIFF
jgi:hypothetical protein